MFFLLLILWYVHDVEMAFYTEDECNAFYGTDQTVFPAFMNPDEGIGAYEPLICRTLVSYEFVTTLFKLKRFFLKNSIIQEFFFFFVSTVQFLEYHSKAKYRGVPGMRFELDIGSPINIKNCFCREEDECPPKGAIDLFRCNGMQAKCYRF